MADLKALIKQGEGVSLEFKECRRTLNRDVAITGQIDAQAFGQVTPTVTPTVAPTVASTVLALLDLLHKAGESGNIEIRTALGLKDRVHIHKSYLQPALQSGYIEMTILDKPHSSKQKYRLTDAGKRSTWTIPETPFSRSLTKKPAARFERTRPVSSNGRRLTSFSSSRMTRFGQREHRVNSL